MVFKKVSLHLNDGTNPVLFHFQDFADIVEQKIGHDAARWLQDLLDSLESKADYTAERIHSDLTSYEHSLESNTTAFNDILDEVEAIRTVLRADRINRGTISEALNEIVRIINNQI